MTPIVNCHPFLSTGQGELERGGNWLYYKIKVSYISFDKLKDTEHTQYVTADKESDVSSPQSV